MQKLRCIVSGDIIYQRRSQDFSRGANNDPNRSNPPPTYHNVFMLYTFNLLLPMRLFPPQFLWSVHQ